MDFVTMARRLHREALRSTTGPTDPTNDTERNLLLFDKINDAWVQLQQEREWRWMMQVLDTPLTTGVQIYSGAELGADRFGNWRREDERYQPWCYMPGSPNSLFPLHFWQLDDFRFQFIYQQVGPTVPVAWSIDEGERLLVGPAPSADYQIRIEQWKEPLSLRLATDEPDMPSKFQMIIVWAALMNLARESNTPEVFDKASTNWTDMHGALLLDQAKQLPR